MAQEAQGIASLPMADEVQRVTGGGQMARRQRPDIDSLLTEAQLAYLAASFAPGAGALEASGEAPEFPTSDMSVMEMLRGPRAASLKENIEEGNYGTAALQGLGVLGDAAMAVPVVGPAAAAALKGPRALQRALQLASAKQLPAEEVEGLYRTLLEIGYPEPTAAKIALGDLPMDEASRMERAREQGYRQEAFHAGSPELASAEAIDPDAGRFERAYSGSFMTNTPVLGNTYVPPDIEKGGAMYRFLMRDEEYPVVLGGGRNWNEIDGYLDVPGQPDLERISGSTNEIARELRARGFPGVTFQDITDIGPNYKAASSAAEMMAGRDRELRRALLSDMSDAEIYSVFDPSTVRLPQAAFDPDQRGSANLLASPAAAGIGAAYLASRARNENK